MTDPTVVSAIDPSEAAKWAAAIVSGLGLTAFGIKRFLILWSKESTQASGASAANDIIAALRSEIDRLRTGTRDTLQENDELLHKVAKLQRQVLDLRNAKHKLKLNNRYYREKLLEGREDLLSHLEDDDDDDDHPAFSDTDIDEESFTRKRNSDI